MGKDYHHKLPSIDALLRSSFGKTLVGTYGHDLVLAHIRQEQAELRTTHEKTGIWPDRLTDLEFLQTIEKSISQLMTPSLCPILNLTGTVLHTNLGRAPLPAEAIQAINAVSIGASNLEFDLGTGRRGDRDDHIESWICRLTGAEAATVVNNNAAAVMLTLNSLASRKEVIVSRGELVEIGGAFRVPDIMKRAGCKLREVGTTNRTHPHDYADNVNERTAMIMRVHTSNYEVRGFTKSVPGSIISGIAQKANLPFVVDLGSGALIELGRFGLPNEPTASAAIADGADIVTFSGDKLLGGPQAGLIAGRKSLIKKIKANPMKRALRVDKMTLAALGAILPMYSDPTTIVARIPALGLLTREPSEIAAQATRVLAQVPDRWHIKFDVTIRDCSSQIGSGAQPLELLPSKAVSFKPKKKKGGGELKRLAEKLRRAEVPVIGRVEAGALLLDLRCLQDEGLLIKQLSDLEI